jgi:hypothetical protein
LASGDPVPWSYIAQRIATVTIAANSALFTTEIVVATITGFLTAGQRYRICFYGYMNSTVALDQGSSRLREDSITGTQFVQQNIDLRQAGTTGYQANLYGEYVAVATANKTFVVTAVRVSGTGNLQMPAGASRMSYLTLDLIPQ